MSVRIAPIARDQFSSIWPILEPVLRAGDSYALDPDMSEAQAEALWFAPGAVVYAATLEDAVSGTYYLKANGGGGARHVANAGFAAAPGARGRGLGRAMGEHALEEARRLGFRAMQFNFVISSNAPALRLWRSLGFTIVGVLPEAFQTPKGTFVEAYVMRRAL